MDRNWITTSKLGDPKYDAGVMEFIRFAVENNSEGREKLPCPCYVCHNLMYYKVDVILSHLRKWEFDRTYTCWHRHGEKRERAAQTTQQGPSSNDDNRLEDMMNEFEEIVDNDPNIVGELLSDFEKPLYTGCIKYNKLSALLKLYNLKVGHSWTDKSFTALLELLIDILPPDNVLPNNTYEAKKILCTMGLRYEKIHACPNDCILYLDEFGSLKSCPECNVSRYKKKEGVPANVLWYFPIIPMFKRWYSNPGDAEKLTWHKFGRKKDDGLLRHPADSPQWRFIDGKFPDFGKEERNLRLGLSTDGMNPFRSLSSSHSTWPVMLVTYNLPPSLCMKRKFIMLSMIISGPKQPGNNIDVYLKPLIDDLKLLYGFCDSNYLSPLTPMENEDDRSDYLSRVFACNNGKNKNQLFFAPYHEGLHWMLAVICPWVGLVHWLDPAGAENEPREFAQDVINKGIIKFSMEHRKDIIKMKKNPYIKWKKIECPRQPPDTNDCRYYVCRYMIEIIESRQLYVPDKYFDKVPSTYSQQMIDELRELWISYVTDKHQQGSDDDDDLFEL